MGLSSFMSNGLFLMFSVTMTRFETVGLTFPPRWENSVSQNRFSQYSSRERKVGFCGFSRELLPRQTLDPVTLKNGHGTAELSPRTFPLEGEHVHASVFYMVDNSGRLNVPSCILRSL